MVSKDGDRVTIDAWPSNCRYRRHICRSETPFEKYLIGYRFAGTILDADVVSEIGVKPEGTDRAVVIHGIGGSEIVFTKWFDSVTLGDNSVNPCKIEIGAMDYGIDIQGILGFDFIRDAKLVIDTVRMQVYSFGQENS